MELKERIEELNGKKMNLALIYIGFLGISAYNCKANATQFKGSYANMKNILMLSGIIGTIVYYALLIWSFWYFPWWKPIVTWLGAMIAGGISAILFQTNIVGIVLSPICVLVFSVLAFVNFITDGKEINTVTLCCIGFLAAIIGLVLTYTSSKTNTTSRVTNYSTRRMSEDSVKTTENANLQLFLARLKDVYECDSSIKQAINDIIVKDPASWKMFCLKYRNFYHPIYPIGKEVFIKMEDDGRIVRGIIKNNMSFDVTWWRYEIEFDEEISINNCWPVHNHRLSDKQIRDIETFKLLGSDCHYVF